MTTASKYAPSAVLSVEAAADWLPMEARGAQAWLRGAGLVRRIGSGRDQVEVVVWGDVIDAIRTNASAVLPLTTWRAVAAAVGVSEDTVARRRASAGDEHPPWFADGAAARSWYASLIAPPPATRKGRRKSKPAARAGVVDWNAAARGQF